MKTFVFLLLLTNLAYFGWNQGWFGEHGRPAVPAARPDTAPSPFLQAPQSLTLIEELSPAERAALGAEPAGLPEQRLEPAPVPEPVPWCADFGRFESQQQAQALVAELQALGMEVSLGSGEVPVSSTFWVHIPAFASEAEAQERLQELQARGIDSYYMRSGELAGGISLGVFSRRDSAELVQDNLAQQGYQTEIGEVFRQERRWWLELRAPADTLLESPEWRAFRALHSSDQITEKVCEVVASATQFP